jgi:hypothetical protein
VIATVGHPRDTRAVDGPRLWHQGVAFRMRRQRPKKAS